MRKYAAVMIGVLMTLCMAACGGGNPSAQEASKGSATESGSSAAKETLGSAAKETVDSAAKKTEAEKTGSSEARKINDPEGYRYKYGDDVIMLDTENVRVSARRMSYKEGVLTFMANMRDKTGNDLVGEQYLVKGAEIDKGGFKSAAGKDDGFRLARVDDWNQMIGETEDCFLGTYYLFVRKSSEHDHYIEKVKLDLYLSEKNPFVNIVSGDDVDLPEDVRAKLEEKTEKQIAAEKELEEWKKAVEESYAPKKEVDEQLLKEVDAALAGTWLFGGVTAFTFDNGKVTRVTSVKDPDSKTAEGTYEIDVENSKIKITINEDGGSTIFRKHYTFKDGILTFTGADAFTRQ